MAKDDLSVNINVGLNVDKAKLKETKEELQFILELQKELGLEGTSKIRIGGYSTGNSANKVSRNKAAKQFEKMGGDFSGVDIADKAQAELAKQYNDFSKELGKFFNIDFIPDAAAALGQVEFSIPDFEKIFNSSATAKEYKDSVQKATEDFFMDALGEVTISPAMFLAAAEKVIKNNPDLYMPTGMKQAKSLSWMQTGGPISPTPIFRGKESLQATPTQVATFDRIAEENIAKLGGEKMAAAFTYAVGKDLDEIVIGAWEKASKEVASNKDIKQILKDDPTFSISGIAASDAFANLEIYFMERFIENVKEGELAKGYQPSSFASNLASIKSASRGDTLLNLPDDPMNVLPKEKIINWLNTMIEDGVMHPLQQVFENPGILGKAFISNSESTVKGAFTRLVNSSSGEEQLSKKAQAEKRYNDQVLQQIKDQVDAYKELNGLKAEATEAAPALSGFDQAKSILLEQKRIADEQNKKLMVSMDTEFLGRKDFKGENITELSVMIKDLAVEGKKFVEVFKFMQTPTDDKAFYAMTGKFPAGSARSSKDMYERGQKAGIPAEQIGKPGDAEGNFLLYRKKIQDAIEVIKLVNELGGVITGSNLDAETTALKKAVENINNSPFNSKLGMDKLSLPEYQRYNAKGEVSVSPFKNVFDPTKQMSELISKDTSGRVAQIFDNKEMTKGVSGALGNVIVKIGTEFEEFFNQYADSVKLTVDKQSFVARDGDQRLPAHFASTDAKASLIIVDFLEELGTGAATLLTPAVKNINDKIMAKVDAVLKAGGSGGGKGPTTPLASADKPDEGGGSDRSAQALQRAFLSANAYEQLTLKLTEQEKTIIANRISALRQTEDLIAISAALLDREKEVFLRQAEAIEIRRGLTDREAARANQAAASGAQGPMQSPGAQRYYEQVKGVVALRKEMLELNEAGQKLELSEISLAVQQQRRGDVTEQLTQNLRKQLDANIENTQAGKSATAQIKNQMQEQVNAQKAVQRQTQSLMNTWVTSRYALYDIGNFYQNVSQNLIRAARAIFDTTRSYRSFETAFTSVERAMQLSQEGAVDLRNQFVQLSETIPVSFEEISRIATLGAQMGIAADGIVGFTETIAKFSSITGISAETVAQQFGRIAELADVDPSEFNNLGSAVAFAGVNAVATESEILTLSQSIAAVSNQVGITAPEIIGLGTALASVGIPAEQARGVFTRVFADIDRAASLGGKSLQGLSQVTGLSAEKISSSWGQEGAANEVFVALLKGLNASENLTAAFDSLNIVETREINTLTRLAKNMDVVMQALDDAGMSFESATFLGDSFDRTADNLDSKLTLLRTNFDSLTASLSAGFAPALGIVVDGMSALFRFLKGAEDSFLFRAVLPATGAVIALGAATAAGAAILAKLTAQLYAFRVAQINAANSPTAVDGTIKQVKALLGLNSGLIEVRNNVAGINERGLIEPVNFDGLFTKQDKHQKQLLKEKNLYYSLGEQVKKTAIAKEAGAVTGVQLARLEADLVNKAIAQQQNKIVVEQKILDDLASARTAAASSGLKDQAVLIDAEMATQAQKIQTLKTEQLYLTFYKGEALVINENTLAQYRNAQASAGVSAAKKAEQTARASNATAINLETRAASQAFTSLAGKVTGFLGVAGLLATLIPTVLALGDAIANMNKIDLIESGGGIESFREAILKDTQAIEEGSMQAVATAQVQYKTYTTEVDKRSEAIMRAVKVDGLVTGSTSRVTEQIRSQNVAIGQNTKEWLANAIMKNEQLQDIDFDEIQKTMAELSLDFDGLIQDMVNSANNPDAEINPLRGIEAQIEAIKNNPALKSFDIEGLAAPENAFMLGIYSEEVQNLVAEFNKLRGVQNLLGSVFDTVKKAFSDTSLWASIKSALGLEGVENSITKVIDKYKKAIETGKGMKPVMNDIKAAVISMLSEADKTDEALTFDINEASTLDGLIKIVKGLISTRIASEEVQKALANVGTSAFYTAAGRAALDSAMGIEELKEILSSLQAVAAGGSVELDKLGGAAESAADKLARLLNEANSATQKILDLNSSVRALGKSMAESKDFSFDTDLGAANISSVLSVIESIGTRAGGNFKRAERDLNIFKLTLQDMGAPQQAIDLVNRAIGKLGGSTNLTSKQAQALRKEFAAIFGTFKTNFQTGFNEVNKVENKIRSLTDFVGDLRGVLQSAFEIRYGAQTGLDAITTAWLNMSQAAKEAEKAVKSANDEINQSMADKTVLQYQLSVAQRYNDEKRAAVIRAKLAKLDQQILDQQQQLADANSANDKSLVGNTKSAIDNRAKVRDLVTQYNSYLLSLANTNMSSTDLAAKAKELETDFLAQGIALGYAEKDLKSYTAAFANDFTKVLNGVPRDITITVKTDPALRAIEEFVAKAQTEIAKISAMTPPVPVVPVQDFSGNGVNDRPGPEGIGQSVGQTVTGTGGRFQWVWNGSTWDRGARLASGGYVSGPGSKTSDSIPAMLSNGEYVIQARSVSAYGLDFMNALNQQRVGFAPAQGSFNGSSAGGSQMVYLSPEDRALLRAAVDRPIALYTENTKIAQSANAGNVLLAQRGTN